MAIITGAQLLDVRRRLEAERQQIAYTKAQVNAAIQAIEDAFEGFRPTLVSAINTATLPLVLSGPVKLALVRSYLLYKFLKGL